MASATDHAGLERMRRFVPDVFSGRAEPAGTEPPPLRLLQLAHMAPIAYKRGHKAFQGDYAAGTRDIRVLNAQNEAAAMVPCNGSVKQGRSRATDMY